MQTMLTEMAFQTTKMVVQTLLETPPWIDLDAKMQMMMDNRMVETSSSTNLLSGTIPTVMDSVITMAPMITMGTIVQMSLGSGRERMAPVVRFGIQS